MKTRNLLFVLLAVALVMGSCAKVNELTDIIFNAAFKVDLNADVPPGSFKSGINGAFSVMETIDPLSDPEVEKYIDNIKSWEVTGITGEIIAVSKAGVNLVSADLEVFSDTHSTSWLVPSTPLEIGEKIVLGNDNGEWDSLNDILGEKNVFTVSLEGATDEDDVTFTIQVTIETKITANPL